MRFVTTFVLSAVILINPGMVPGLSFVVLDQAPMQNPEDGAAQQGSEAEEANDRGGLQDVVILRSGTEVKLMFAQSLSSKHATVGEKIELRVEEDVNVDHIVVVPAGARVLGTVVQGKKNEKYGNSRDLAINVDYIAVKGKRIKLNGEQQQKAKTNIGSATAATIGLGLSGLIIYMSQREAWIREGTPAKAYIAEDVVFTQPDLFPAAKASDRKP
jgi:hypothetical protein